MTAKSRRKVASKAFVFGLALWIGAPLAAIGALTVASTHATITRGQEAVWIRVATPPRTTTSQADLALQWSGTPVVVAPQWSGLVQDIAIRPGQTLQAGTRVTRIDGIWRLTAPTPEPFYRKLEPGDFGTDVSQLNNYLSELELPHGTTATYDAATARGVASLARLIGASETRAFDPSWLVYVRSKKFVVRESKLVTGSPAPSPGTEIISGLNHLKAAALVQSGVFDAKQDDPKASISDTELAENYERVPTGAHVEVGGTRLQALNSQSRLGKPDLTKVQRLTNSGDLTLQVNLVQPAARGSIEVPASAVILGQSGQECLLVRHGTTSSKTRIKTVSSSDSGMIVASGRVLPGAEVAIAPSAREQSCS